MGRRRRRSEPAIDPLRDLSIPITRLSLQPLVEPVRRRDVLELEDRRRYHPLRTAAPAQAVRPSARRIVVGRDVQAINFARPREVSVCVRRQQRKEVLHANKVAGSKGIRKGKRNWFSEVRCKK